MINSLLSFFTYLFRMIKSMIFMPFLRVMRKTRTFANPLPYAAKLAKLIGGFFKKKVKIKPEKMGDYIEFRRRYVAKSLFIVIPLLVVALIYVSIVYIHPWIVSKYFTAVFYEDNAKLVQYNGKVKVLSKENKNVLYQGRLENGFKKGYGKVCLKDGTIQYDGDFLNGMYEGFGKLYDSKGKLVYQGQFSVGEKQGSGKEYFPDGGGLHYEGAYVAGQMEGEGILYYENSKMEYKGSFVAGVKEGEGTLYSENGTMIYKGAFLAGEKEGKGILYTEKGTVKYKGDFLAGQMEGQGSVYDDNGVLIYKGAFVAGKYEGEGTLYNKDGSVLYSGGFLAGAYSGKGKLYLEGTSKYIEGEFLEGKAQGPGAYYDKGLKIYEGNYFADKRQGDGKLYSKIGEVVFQGVFQDDSMVISGLFEVDAAGLAGYFPQKAEYMQYENSFTFAPKDAMCLLELNYAEEELPATVQYIYFWRSESSGLKMMADNEVSADNLDILMGKPIDEGYEFVNPVMEDALIRAGLEDIGTGDMINTKIYMKDGLKYTFYFSEGSSEIKLLKVGKGEIDG